MECLPDAAVGAAVALVQLKYVLPIVGALLGGPLRFAALGRAAGVASATTLRQRLRELSGAGVLRRGGEHYQLTQRGAALRPVFEALAAFTAAHPQHDPQRILGLLQRRHAMAVMRELRGGPLGFNELQRAVGARSATTLTRRLHELDACGLLVRVADAGGAPHPRYAHSAAGEAFSPVVGQVVAWGLGSGLG